MVSKDNIERLTNWLTPARYQELKDHIVNTEETRMSLNIWMRDEMGIEQALRILILDILSFNNEDNYFSEIEDIKAADDNKEEESDNN